MFIHQGVVCFSMVLASTCQPTRCHIFDLLSHIAVMSSKHSAEILSSHESTFLCFVLTFCSSCLVIVVSYWATSCKIRLVLRKFSFHLALGSLTQLIDMYTCSLDAKDGFKLLLIGRFCCCCCLNGVSKAFPTSFSFVIVICISGDSVRLDLADLFLLKIPFNSAFSLFAFAFIFRSLFIQN